MELTYTEGVHLDFFLFYLAVNKLIADKTQNIFSFMAEYSVFIKFTLNKPNKERVPEA